jgi:hypothetical protein
LFGKPIKDAREAVGQILKHALWLLCHFTLPRHIRRDRSNANNTSGRNALTGGDPAYIRTGSVNGLPGLGGM